MKVIVKGRIHRDQLEMFSIEGIFYWILSEIERVGYLSPETVEDIRHTPEYKDLYERRKETIERVFADAKEKHAMRYTPYRGLSQVTNWVRLKLVAMNLKKTLNLSCNSGFFYRLKALPTGRAFYIKGHYRLF